MFIIWWFKAQLVSHFSQALQQIICQEGVVQEVVNDFHPIIYNSQNTINEILEEDFQILAMQNLTIMYENMPPNQQFFVQSQLVSTYFHEEKNFNTLIFQQILFELLDKKLQKIQFLMIKKMSVKLQEGQKLLQIYQIQKQLILYCETQENYEFNYYNYSDQFFNDEIQYPFKIITIVKNNNCKNKNLYEDFDLFIYFAEFNCSDWRLFKIENSELNLIWNAQKTNGTNLQNIVRKRGNIHLVFQNQITQLFPSNEEKLDSEVNSSDFQYSILYSIIDFDQTEIIIFYNLSQNCCERKINIIENILENKQYFVINFEYKQLLLYRHNLIFLIDGTKKEQNPITKLLDFVYLIQADFLLIDIPFLFGLNKDILMMMKIHRKSRFFSCDSYKNQTKIFYQFDQHSIIPILLEQQLIFISNYQINYNITETFKMKNSIQMEIIGKDFNFILDYDKKKVGTKIKFLSDEILNCKAQESYIDENGLIRRKLKILWKTVLMINNKIFLLFQTKELKLYLYQIQNEYLQFLRVIEEINFRNLYQCKTSIILIHNNSKSIYLLNFQEYPKIKQFFLNVQSQILSASIKSDKLQVIVSTCQIIVIQGSDYDQFYYSNLKRNGSLQCEDNMIVTQQQIIQIQSNKIKILNDICTITQVLAQDAEIIKIFQVAQKNYYIILMQLGDETYIYKYALFDFQFLKLFKLPQLQYKIMLPLIYAYNELYLIVLSQSTEDPLCNVLLIYYLENNFYNILIDVIERVDLQNFGFISIDSFYYYKDNIIHYNQFQKIQITCLLKSTNFFKKDFQLTFQEMSYQYETSQKKVGFIKMTLINRIKKLESKVPDLQMHLINQPSFDFDVRQYVIGPINSLQSDDFNISNPFSKVLLGISRKLCPVILNLICINYEQNYIIPNLFHQLKYNFIISKQSTIFKKDQLYIIQDRLKITIFDSNFIYLAEGVVPQDCEFYEVLIMKDSLLGFCEKLILIFNIDNLVFIKLFSINCFECKIVKIQNNINQVIIFSARQLANQFWYLVLNDEEQFQLNELAINGLPEINFPFFFEIWNVIEYDTYLTALVYNQNYFNHGYIIQGKIYKQDNSFKLSTPLGIIRTWNKIPFFFKFLSNDILYQIDNSLELKLFNISQIQYFEYIDSIFQFSLQNKTIERINDSHIILISQTNEPHQIIEILSYQFSKPPQVNQGSQITFYNKVSELKFQIFIEQEQKQGSIYFPLTILVLLIVFLYFVRRLWLKKFQKSQNQYLSNQRREFEN